MTGMRNLALVLGMTGLLTAVPLLNRPAKTGCVNVEKVFEAYRRMPSVEVRIEALRKESEPKQNSKREEMQSLRQELLNKASVLSADEKREREEALETKMNELREMIREEERSREALKRELIAEILAGVQGMG